MRISIIDGKLLPESYEEFIALRDAPVFQPLGVKHRACVDCGEPFAPANTDSAAGWRETQISGMCEKCFDALFQEDA